MITIDDRNYQIFCFGQYKQRGQKLTDIQQKIYNMLKAGFRIAYIAERLNINPSSVYVHQTSIRAKGWNTDSEKGYK